MSDSGFVIDDLINKSEAEREIIATKVGKSLSQKLDKAERKAVEELAKVLAIDTAESVRQGLVKEVMNCPFLPVEVATKIANDASNVSENFLHNYDSGDDAALATLARECEEKAREVLAKRNGLPEPASFAISEVGAERSVANLMENQTAVISERVCSKVTDRFKDSPEIMVGMSKRSDLPLSSIALIIDHLAEDVANSLVKKYDIGEDLAHYIAGQAKRTTMDDAISKAPNPDLVTYFKGLKVDGLLNDGMLLQILQSKDVGKFTIAVSVRSEIEEDKVAKILDSGEKGHFFRLMEKMKVSDALAGIIYSAYLEALQSAEGLGENEQAT